MHNIYIFQQKNSTNDAINCWREEMTWVTARAGSKTNPSFFPQTIPSAHRVWPVAEAVARGLGMGVNKGKGQRSQTAINLTAETHILCAVQRRTVAPLSWCLHCQHGQVLQNKCIGQQNAWFINSTKSKNVLYWSLTLFQCLFLPFRASTTYQPSEDRSTSFSWWSQAEG